VLRWPALLTSMVFWQPGSVISAVLMLSSAFVFEPNKFLLLLYTVTNKINDWSKYSSSTVKNHHGSINAICWICKVKKVYWPKSKKLADFMIKNRICSMLVACISDDIFLLADFIGRQNWSTLSIIRHAVCIAMKCCNNVLVVFVVVVVVLSVAVVVYIEVSLESGVHCSCVLYGDVVVLVKVKVVNLYSESLRTCL